MRILIIGPGMGLPIPPQGWGGIEKVIWYHAVELRKRGHHVLIFNERDHDKLVETARQGWDVIHVHQEWCVFTLRQKGIPFIFTSHMGSWERNWTRVENLLTECTMAMPFELMAKRLSRAEKWPIWNGADPALFKPGEKEPGLCLAVGRNEPRKKFEEIILEVGRDLSRRLILIGPGTDTFRGYDHVQTMPNQPEEEIAKLLGRAQVFYHLADEEADCLVVKEAAMAGCELVLSPYCEEVLLASDCFRNTPKHSIEPGFARYLATRYTWEEVVKNLEKGYQQYAATAS